jgi:hypothetical protein
MNLHRLCREFAVELVVLSLVVLGIANAHAQVTDRPITKMPDLSAVTMDTNIEERRACAVWWGLDDDKFGDWQLRRAFCRDAGCYAFGTDLKKMTVARTRNVADADVAACVARMQPRPAATWVVDRPTSTDGTRPVYCLKADGTRDTKACDRVSDVIKGNGGDAGKSTPRWCYCQRRSKETTTGGPYCAYADDKPDRNLRDAVVRVVACRPGQ